MPSPSCLTSGQCFRLVQALDGTGHAQHCPYLIDWRGRFKDTAGKGTQWKRATDAGRTWTQSSGSIGLLRSVRDCRPKPFNRPGLPYLPR